MTSRLLRTAVLTAVLVVATATAAAAHPGFRPGEVPAGGPVEVELVVPHGCGSEEGGGSPTVEVLVEQTEELTLTPMPLQGWTTVSEDGAAGWVDDGGATADEVLLPARVDVTAEVGTTLDVAVYQACENGDSYRWAAGEGEDGDPAVRLTVVGGTPPPLPDPSPTQAATPTPDPTPTAGETSTPTPEPTPAPTPSPTPSPSVSPTPTPSPTASPTATPAPSASPTMAADDADDSGSSAGGLAAVIAALIAALAGGGYLVNRNRSGSDDAGEAGGAGGTGGAE